MRGTCGVGSAKAPLRASPTPPPPLGSRVGRLPLPGDGEPPSGSRLQSPLLRQRANRGENPRRPLCTLHRSAPLVRTRPPTRGLAPLHLHLVRVTLRSQSRLLVRYSFSSGGHESSNALAVVLQRLSLPRDKGGSTTIRVTICVCAHCHSERTVHRAQFASAALVHISVPPARFLSPCAPRAARPQGQSQRTITKNGMIH